MKCSQREVLLVLIASVVKAILDLHVSKGYHEAITDN